MIKWEKLKQWQKIKLIVLQNRKNKKILFSLSNKIDNSPSNKNKNKNCFKQLFQQTFNWLLLYAIHLQKRNSDNKVNHWTRSHIEILVIISWLVDRRILEKLWWKRSLQREKLFPCRKQLWSKWHLTTMEKKKRKKKKIFSIKSN